MQILMAVGGDNVPTVNPFVRSLADGLRRHGHEVDCSAEGFWSAQGKYDIVHVHWPQALFGWQDESIDSGAVERLSLQVRGIRAAGGVVCYTRHNSVPHVCSNPHSAALNRVMEESSDLVIHLGDFSLAEFAKAHPLSTVEQVVVPHHAYDWYPREMSRAAARAALNLESDEPTVLAFGEFRSPGERLLLAEACAGVRGPLEVIAPLLFVYSGGEKDVDADRKVSAMLAGRMPRQRSGRVRESDMPAYFLSADVVFIQRIEILNSGNLPLAFHFGKVVVGPDCGNVGEILRSTGNPVFDPSDPKSAASALEEGLRLASKGKGAENMRYADENWGCEKTVLRLLDAYRLAVDRGAPCVSVVMPSLNTADYIDAAIESVLGQTLKDIELICVDAGSSDGTREIIAKHAARDGRVRVIDSPVKSYGSQMNLGIAAARGRYIGIVEPDDYIESSMCEELYATAFRENLDIVKGNCICFTTDEEGRERLTVVSPFGNDMHRYGRVVDPIDAPELFRQGTLGTTLGIYRREMIVQNAVIYNESPGASYQDTGFFFQTILCARRFMAVDKAYYHYRQDNQASSRNDKSRLMVLWNEYEFVEKRLAEHADARRLAAFKPYLLGRCLSGQLWTVRRIGFEASGALVELVKRKFADSMSSGRIRRRHLPSGDWDVLVSWVVDELPGGCTCKVSVVIPCYNVSSYVATCLDSVLGQSLKELECLCVDDGSTDDTVDILKRYAALDSRVKCFLNGHLGVYEARNRALREAKGEFVAFMDPDDLYPSNDVLEKLHFAAKRNGLLAAGGSLRSFLPDGAVLPNKNPKNEFAKNETVAFSRYQWALGYQRFIYSRLLLRRMDVWFPPFVRFQDPPFMAAALIAAEEFRAIPDVTYSYRIGYKKPDWKENGCRRFRDLLKALAMMAGQAAEAYLPDLMGLVESELDAHLERVVRPDKAMLSACAEELAAVRGAIKRFREKDAGPGGEANRRIAGGGGRGVRNISMLKLFLPYAFMRWWVARRYGYRWPGCGLAGVLPFFLVTALMQRTAADRRPIKYLLPYGIMCRRMFTRYGYDSWNGVPLDGVSPERPEPPCGRRAALPFGTIIFLDRNSQ